MNKVIDIVQFGSSIQFETEPNDIDIAVIFEDISLEEQLNIAQNIKKILKNQTTKPIHIKTYTFRNLFAQSNFAKQSILFGISVLTKNFFAISLDLKPEIKVIYSLKDLQKKDKVRFNYFLQKKKGGFLNLSQGKITTPGEIEFNPTFEKYFLKNTPKEIKYEIKKNLNMQVHSSKAVSILMDKN